MGLESSTRGPLKRGDFVEVVNAYDHVKGWLGVITWVYPDGNVDFVNDFTRAPGGYQPGLRADRFRVIAPERLRREDRMFMTVMLENYEDPRFMLEGDPAWMRKPGIVAEVKRLVSVAA